MQNDDPFAVTPIPLPEGENTEHRRRPGRDAANPETYKETEGKVDLTLCPPAALAAMAKAFEHGLTKYPARFSWRNNVAELKLLAAALRHVYLHISGETADKESGVTHLGHALASIAMAVDNANQKDPGFYK